MFDNDIGSGSVSPLIVTGGKAGDVGIHDFRYIATGRTKKNRHVDNSEPSTSSSLSTGSGSKSVEQNGMLWYIPKAHSGKGLFFFSPSTYIISVIHLSNLFIY